MLDQIKSVIQSSQSQLFESFSKNLAFWTYALYCLIMLTVITVCYKFVKWILDHPKDKNRNIW